MPEPARRRLLMFGATGQIGRELARASWASGIELTSMDRAAADFRDPSGLKVVVETLRPDAVIVAAAYTAVDKAEGEEALAMRVNAQAPAAIAAAAARRGVPIVLLSSDYVFDGSKRTPYTETDAPNPLNAYGRTKLAGEERVRDANPRHLILRASWVYSAFGTNFVKTMLQAAATRDAISVVADQKGCPTSARDIAGALKELVPQLIDSETMSGTFHLAGSVATTWHGFADAIFDALRARGLRTPRNVPVSTDAFPRPARRPPYSVLSSERIAVESGIRLSGFEEALAVVLDELLPRPQARERRAGQ